MTLRSKIKIHFSTYEPKFIIIDKKLYENTLLRNDDTTPYPVNLMANVGLRDNKGIYQITKQQRQDCIYIAAVHHVTRATMSGI